MGREKQGLLLLFSTSPAVLFDFSELYAYFLIEISFNLLQVFQIIEMFTIVTCQQSKLSLLNLLKFIIWRLTHLPKSFYSIIK